MDALAAALPAWLAPFIPDTTTLLTVAPLALVAGVGALAFAGWLRCRRGVRTPYTRKIFHFVIFTLATGVQLRWQVAGVVVFGSVIAALVLLAVLRGDGHPAYEALARPSDAPRRTLFILIPLLTTALGGVAANMLFAPTAYLGYLVAGWGDAVGEPVGTRWGRHRYRVPSLGGVPATRSLEGSTAVLLFGFVAALLGGYAAGLGPDALRVAAAAAAAGALVEAISNHGLDNLTVQVAAAGAAALVI